MSVTLVTKHVMNSCQVEQGSAVFSIHFTVKGVEPGTLLRLALNSITKWTSKSVVKHLKEDWLIRSLKVILSLR